MIVVNYSDFRNHLAHNLDAVNVDREIVVVSRTQGKNAVIMDMNEYNAMQETLHLLSSAANRIRLDDAIEEMNNGKSFAHPLIEE